MTKENLIQNDQEDAMLSIILRDNGILNEITKRFDVSYFSSPQKQEIYKAMLSLYEEREPFDLKILKTRLEERDYHDNVNGYLERINNLAESGYSNLYLKDVWRVVNAVREGALRRKLNDLGEKILSETNNPGKKLVDLVSESESEIKDITIEMGKGIESSSAQELHRKKGDQLNELAEINRPNKLFERQYPEVEKLCKEQIERNLVGIPTGFSTLDSYLGGLKHSHLTIIGGRPGMGKTSLIRNIMINIGLYQKKPVALFDFESSVQDTMLAMICSLKRLNYKEIREGVIRGWEGFGEGSGMMKDAELHLCDNHNLNINDIICKTRSLKKDRGIEGIFIDNLESLQGRDPNLPSSYFSHRLKDLAVEEDIFVVRLSPLVQEVDKRNDKRPKLSDLTGGGAVESDADCILFLYRDEYYNPDSKDKELCEVDIAKRRWGSREKMKLKFIKECMRFEDYPDSVQK